MYRTSTIGVTQRYCWCSSWALHILAVNAHPHGTPHALYRVLQSCSMTIDDYAKKMGIRSCLTFVLFSVILHSIALLTSWKVNMCMIKIFLGGGGRSGDTFKTPSPYEQLLPLPTPCFKMFLERSLNDPPPPHFKNPSLLPPSPSTTPPPLKILIIHYVIYATMNCFP